VKVAPSRGQKEKRHEVRSRSPPLRCWCLYQRDQRRLAAGKTSKSADGVSCSFSVAQGASPAARCAAIKRQCGGKFYANYCGDKLLSAM
jgi:hypothetical protein